MDCECEKQITFDGVSYSTVTLSDRWTIEY